MLSQPHIRIGDFLRALEKATRFRPIVLCAAHDGRYHFSVQRRRHDNADSNFKKFPPSIRRPHEEQNRTPRIPSLAGRPPTLSVDGGWDARQLCWNNFSAAFPGGFFFPELTHLSALQACHEQPRQHR
jgi:hypothetical protein